MRKRKAIAITLVLAVLGVVSFILSKIDFSGPTKLPATRKALGLEIKLLDCRRLANGQVQVKMTVAGRGGGWPEPDVQIGDIAAKSGNVEGECTRGETGNPLGSPMETTTYFHFSERVDSVDVSLPIHIHRADKDVSFKFANITPASLPQTQKVGCYEMTLKSATDNCLPSDPPWQAWITYGSISPGSVPRCFGLQAVTTLSMDEIHDNTPTLLTSGGGIPPDVIFAQFDYTAASALNKPTLMERAVGLFSQQRADLMMQKRQEEFYASGGSSLQANGNYIFGFPMSDRPKGSFTFEVRFVLPPDKKDAAVVEFKNVPVR